MSTMSASDLRGWIKENATDVPVWALKSGLPVVATATSFADPPPTKVQAADHSGEEQPPIFDGDEVVASVNLEQAPPSLTEMVTAAAGRVAQSVLPPSTDNGLRGPFGDASGGMNEPDTNPHYNPDNMSLG